MSTLFHIHGACLPTTHRDWLGKGSSLGLEYIKRRGKYKSNKWFDHAKSNDSFKRSLVDYITLLFASSQAIQLHFYTCTMTGAGKSDNCYVSTLSLSLWPELVLHHITGIEWDKALQSVIDCSGRQTPPVHSVNDWLKTLTQPQQRTNKKGTKCLTRWAPSGPSLNHVKLGELHMGPSSRLVTPCWACLFVFCLFVCCLWCKIRADPWQINS